MPRSVLTLDTLAYLLTKHILHPFPFILLALSRAATTIYPLQVYGDRTLVIPLPSGFALLLSIAFVLYVVRSLLAFDTRVANGPRRHIDWEDEVVLITGGLGGLGGQIAEVYGMRGVPVAVLDVRAMTEAEKVQLEEKGVQYFQCDVGDRKQVETTVKDVQEELGHPTILINNAAIVTGKPFLDLTDEEVERTFAVNTFSALQLTRLVLPHMLSRPNGGHIITVSSVLGYTGSAALSAYTASKAALIAWHHSLTAELEIQSSQPTDASSPSVKTLLCTPGQLTTPLFSRIPPPPSFVHAFISQPVSPHDLAKAIVQRIDRGEGGEVSLPLYAGWIGVLRILPAGLAGWCRRWSGLDAGGWSAFGERSRVAEGGGRGEGDMRGRRKVEKRKSDEE